MLRVKDFNTVCSHFFAVGTDGRGNLEELAMPFRNW